VPQYIPALSNVREVHRTAQHVGDSAKATYTILCMHIDVSFTVTEYERPNRFALRADGQMGGTIRTTFTAQGAASTRVDQTEEYQIPGGLIGKVADALLFERMQAKNLETMLENFKRSVESRTGTPA
jgi:uncharacterized membrane protein